MEWDGKALHGGRGAGDGADDMETRQELVTWGGNLITAKVLRWEGDWAVVEIVADLTLDVDAQVRKFFVEGMVLRVHRSSLSRVERPSMAA